MNRHVGINDIKFILLREVVVYWVMVFDVFLYLFKLLIIDPFVKGLPEEKRDLFTSVGWMSVPVFIFVLFGLVQTSSWVAVGAFVVSVVVVGVCLAIYFKYKRGHSVDKSLFLIVVPPVIALGLLLAVGVAYAHLLPLLFRIISLGK